MKFKRMPVVAAAMFIAIPTSPSAAQPATADAYSRDSRWLCLPGRADPCSTPLATTELGPNGYGSKVVSRPAASPAVDCFYVYPTVSSDPGMNSDLIPGREEKIIAEAQLARFASVCRPFAPNYRQMTIAAVAAFATGADIKQPAALAYGDVAAAFRDYIRNRSNGRPFVLIGHSQGSLMLIQLIANVIERDPALAKRMRLAILPGYNLLVPQGRLVGGSLKSTPLCSRPGQTRCVVTWTSFREKNMPPPGAIFGYAAKPGMTVGCVNPARWGAKDWEPLDSDWYTRSAMPVPGGPISWSSQGAPATPYVHTPGLASGRCVNDGVRGYLSIRTNADPADRRTDRIGGEVGLFGMFLPGWGMHLADISVAQGNLVRAVERIGAANGAGSK